MTDASDDDLGWSCALHAVCAAEGIGDGDSYGLEGLGCPDEPKDTTMPMGPQPAAPKQEELFRQTFLAALKALRGI